MRGTDRFLRTSHCDRRVSTTYRLLVLPRSQDFGGTYVVQRACFALEGFLAC